MATRRPFCSRNFDVFTYISKSIVHRVSVPVPNGGFWGMTSLMRVFATFSDSRWPPGGHFVSVTLMFLHISPKVLHIEYPFQFQTQGFEVWRVLWGYLQRSQIQDGRPAAIFSRNFDVFTYISQSIAHRVSIPVPNRVFWGMTSLMRIFATFLDIFTYIYNSIAHRVSVPVPNYKVGVLGIWILWGN